MSMKDSLHNSADARRTRASHPKGFEDGVKFEAGEPSEVVLNLKEIPESEVEWRAEIQRVTRLTIPEHRRVELSQVRYWGNPEAPFVYCRFTITNREHGGDGPDAVKLLAELRRNKRGRPPGVYTGETALVLSWNDWQTGKLSGGGTEALAERLDGAFDAAVARAKELRRIGRDLGRLVVVGGADMIEGCSIFPNQSYEIDSDRRTQVNNTVAFILAGIDRLAPRFENVTFLVVGGNHGENRIGGHRTTRSDNDDCAVFEHAARATARDDRLQHVNYIIADGEPAKTLEVAGWVLGTTHGHVYGKGAGGSIEQKALRWFSGQAAGRQPVGDSDVFLTHHFHHYASRDWGATQWIQTPAMDGGSEWLTDLNGQSSQPGMLSFVMTSQERVKDIQIL